MNGGKTYNLYCDESCHLENDGKDYMLIAYISSAYPQVKLYTEQIKELKTRHNFFGEIKWSKVSRSKYGFYADLVDLFFSTELLYRAVIVPKARIRHKDFAQDHDTFYYKMYYQLLHHKMDMLHTYNIYLDIKDTLSARKVGKLREILNVRYNSIRNLQNMHSKESLLLQLTDFLTGALAYNLNVQEKRMLAKTRLIDKIKAHSNLSLVASTPKDHEKFNLFIIELQ